MNKLGDVLDSCVDGIIQTADMCGLTPGEVLKLVEARVEASVKRRRRCMSIRGSRTTLRDVLLDRSMVTRYTEIHVFAGDVEVAYGTRTDSDILRYVDYTVGHVEWRRYQDMVLVDIGGR